MICREGRSPGFFSENSSEDSAGKGAGKAARSDALPTWNQLGRDDNSLLTSTVLLHIAAARKASDRRVALPFHQQN